MQTVVRLGNTVKEFLISNGSSVFEWFQFKISEGIYGRHRRRIRTTRSAISSVRRWHAVLWQLPTRRHRGSALSSIVLWRQMDEINLWCKSRRLQLNSSKTELIWFGSQSSLAKLSRRGLLTVQSKSGHLRSNRPLSSVTWVFIWTASCPWSCTYVAKVAATC